MIKNENATSHNSGRKVISICVAAAIVFSSGLAWKLHSESAGAARKIGETKSTSLASVETITSIPTPSRESASDKQIALWAEKARKFPQDDRAWANLGDAFMQKGRETFDISYYGHAEAAYKKCLDVNPRKAEGMVGLAWVNGGRHEFEKSTDWANKALVIDPKNSEACGLLGDADVEMGSYDDAFVQYQKMLDLRPDISSYSRGAHALQLSGDTRKASWLMAKAIHSGGAYSENSSWCRAQLALIHFSEGAYLPAEQELTEGLKHTPISYPLLAAMGRVKTAQKDYKAGIEYYKKAIAIAPQLDSVIALGDVYTVTGQKEEAEKQYSLVESIHQLYKANGVRGDMQVAQFYADHDRNLPEALRLAQEEYKTRKNVYAADTLAWCCYKNGKIPEAKQYIDAALARKTPEAIFLFHKGMIYAKAGDSSTAKLSLYQAMSLNAHFHPIYEKEAISMNQELGSHPTSKP